MNSPPSLANSIFAIGNSRELILDCNLKGKRFLHFLGIVAVGYINEAIDEGNPLKTVDGLMLPTAKIRDVDPEHAQHYQDVLYHAKSQKLMVSLRSFVSFQFTDRVREKVERRIFLNHFFLKHMSFLCQQLPVDQNGRNRAIIFLPSNIKGKPAPELMTASTLLLKTQLWVSSCSESKLLDIY